MKALRFSWDSRKASANARKHGVTFEEAESAFEDDFGLLVDDPEHSEVEERFVLLGLTNRIRLIAVVHAVDEGSIQDEIRIISARRATRSEKGAYAKRWKP